MEQSKYSRRKLKASKNDFWPFERQSGVAVEPGGGSVEREQAAQDIQEERKRCHRRSLLKKARSGYKPSAKLRVIHPG